MDGLSGSRDDVDPISYLFSTDRSGLPDDPLLMPTVGNGNLATVIWRDRIFMNGFYNGCGNKSHRAAIPALNRIVLKPPSSTVWERFYLDCMQGVFTHQLNADRYSVRHEIYAHRTIPSVIVNQITIIRSDPATHGDITIDIESGTSFTSPDINLESVTGGANGLRLYNGYIKECEVSGKTPQIQFINICVDEAPTILTLQSGMRQKTFTFIMSINSDFERCQYQYDKAYRLVDTRELLPPHIDAWSALWNSGKIDIWSSDVNISRVVYGCQYYLLSSLPSQYDLDCEVDEFYGLSPESLAYGDMSEDDYLGHVFWDQETWMYPPILLLHPDIADQMLKPRYRVQDQAERNALKSGNKGMRYPWEQGVTGVPTSPSDDCENYEIHINADIALALRQYVYATGKVTDNMVTLASGLAKYWVSRLSYIEEKKMYGISDVMPPDEWHYPVNNSAYTNLAAHLAITLPDYLNTVRGEHKPPPSLALMKSRFPDVTDDWKIYVPFDESKSYHPEFDGYTLDDPTKTSRVKQADVVLIGYPLNVEHNETVRRNDLELYEKVTTSNGPAMTWSMFCVGHLELGQAEKATQLFQKQLLQTNQPFQVWSEYLGGKGAINFITGMGGFLQSVLNGYFGIRLRTDRIDLTTKYLPPDTSRLKLTGLSYHQAKIDIDVSVEKVRITLTSQAATAMSLVQYKVDGTSETTALSPSVPVIIEQSMIDSLSLRPIKDTVGYCCVL